MAAIGANLDVQLDAAQSREKSKGMDVKGWMRPALLALAVVAVITAGAFTWQRMAVPANTTPYQAVLLANGAVYFGRLEGLGTSFPVLREVYYVESGVDAQTRSQKSVLLKRGAEWHAPDYMVLNASQIVLVEPVGKDSRVAALIAESKAGK